MKENKIPALEVHDLTTSYDKNPVLWDIDFKIPPGVMTGIVGPNGSGKTTLLKSIMGLLPPDSGEIFLFGKSLEEVRQKVSYVPQRGSVDWDFPARVKEIVEMGRYGHRGLFSRLTREDKKIAAEALEKVGMENFSSRQISQLSGGQQQRVFLARALAQNADIYLMDEPFAGVDIASEKAIIELLKIIISEGKTVIVVHHDLHSVLNYFDHLVLLNTRLIAAGPAKEVFNPENLSKTYGGHLTLFSEINALIKNTEMPVREPKN